MDIKIIVATHKKYWMPSDDIYLPVHVGKKGKTDLGYQGDDTGDNISDKNTNYCELTGLYWAWKNLKADYKGLAHYRRHFMVRSSKGTKEEKVLNRQQLEELLKRQILFCQIREIILLRQIIVSMYTLIMHRIWMLQDKFWMKSILIM